MCQIGGCRLTADAVVAADNQGLVKVCLCKVLRQVVVAEVRCIADVKLVEAALIADIDYLCALIDQVTGFGDVDTAVLAHGSVSGCWVVSAGLAEQLAIIQAQCA